jgi:hypothetical protein
MSSSTGGHFLPPVTAGGGGGGPADGNTPYVFVYDTTQAADANRYDDWATLIAAVGDVHGPKIIQIDGQETVPAGAWDLNGAGFRGNGVGHGAFGVSGTGAQLTFEDGATITNPSSDFASDGIQLVSASDDHVLEITEAATLIFSRNSYVMSVKLDGLTDPAPFIRVGHSSGTVQLVNEYDSGWTTSFPVLPPAFTQNAPIFLDHQAFVFTEFRDRAGVIGASDASILGDTILTTGNGVAVRYIETLLIDGPDGSLISAASQPLLDAGAGYALVALSSNSYLASYTPFDPSQWTTAPTNTAQALDMIAAAHFLDHGTPI